MGLAPRGPRPRPPARLPPTAATPAACRCRRPLAEPAPGADTPHTALQKQVAQAAPGIFAAAAGGPGPQGPALQPAVPAPAPLAAAQHAAAASAAPPRRAADGKAPAAKRARLANVAVEADRAAVETPAEEASKAAGAGACPGGCCRMQRPVAGAGWPKAQEPTSAKLLLLPATTHLQLRSLPRCTGSCASTRRRRRRWQARTPRRVPRVSRLVLCQAICLPVQCRHCIPVVFSTSLWLASSAATGASLSQPS